MPIWESLRPKQWIKNVFIFSGILFSQNIFNLPLLFKTIVAFLIFCLLAGSAYIFNDLVDLEQDRNHPVKSKRPLASGRLKASSAILFLIIILPPILGISFCLNPSFFFFVLIYILLQLAYSFSLKHMIILDLLAIALSFVLRVAAGALVINVEISSWLLICSFFLAFFLVLGKRKYELVVTKEKVYNHRKNLVKYSPYLLDQMISVLVASTAITYSLYTVSKETMTRLGNRNLIFSIPFVLYGIFRYLYLINQKNLSDSIEDILLKDRPLIIDIGLWVLLIIFILYIR